MDLHNLPPSSSNLPNSESLASNRSLVLRERLRQAKLSFDLAFIMTVVTAVISLAGLSLLFSKRGSEGLITTLGGGSFSVCCYRLAKDANDRLDKIASELDDEH
ncbi:hypothetical protein [Leptolyngbya sp. UWPOB_LEPTO1]|uniref:TRADD-N-associated membrane domain-containing protein n=1 Tax=Leptolyngbya sp. UWPOB_LEPTO1 TaxID=2815653 RepID=UPI00338EA69E